MHSHWFLPVKFPLAWSEFRKLPRHPAYRFEYRRGHLQITGRPEYAHCTLPTSSTGENAPSPNGSIRILKWNEFDSRARCDELFKLFAAATARTLPYSILTPARREQAAVDLIGEALDGYDGPIIPTASQIAVDAATGNLVAAILMTLVAPGSWTDFTDPNWAQTPPADPIASRWGQPHLTWVFVSPDRQRRGLGQQLLTNARLALETLGYPALASTFLLGDHGSMLWHWKQGFELLPGLRSLSPRL
ncbi:Acetyltransferase (GNAT) family protein [Planctomicrobium piriforme]|uniref:Acetyltransferase (GNAT) family protein n=2 Tax=Planctomicrobium piriforme TaxID=1576369 RepID=A0A1I3NPW8_9PLAN|nr:Acetyltransferase (GNAT) family protein [Planctomicrobium piriforme]